MVRYTLRGDHLEDGKPLLYHQNALTYSFINPRRKVPTHIIYPDNRTAVGLQPSSNLSSFLTDATAEAAENDEENMGSPDGSLLVYASPASEELTKPRIVQLFIIFLSCELIQAAILAASIAVAVASKAIFRNIMINCIPYILLLANDAALLCISFRYRNHLVFRLVTLSGVLIAVIAFFASLHSVLDLALLALSPIKLICADRMLFLTVPHVFQIKAAT